MPDIANIIVTGAANPWLYLPAAVLLGALHAMEPGHSKSLMAGFLVAVRGNAAQAVLLGVSAAIGHTLIVWVLVLLALWLGNELIEKQAYPWLVLLSGLMILVIAARLIWSLRRGEHHHHHGPHDAHHNDHDAAHDHHHDHDHSGHDHHHDDHGHSHETPEELAARYGGRQVRNWEVVWFGFTGGLLPCPSAIAVLLVALKLNAFALGVAMVGAFSLGLAVTLVSVGLIAVWGLRKVSGLSGFDRWTRWLPRISVAIVTLLGIAVTIHGLMLIGR